MGRDVAEAHVEAREVFQRADEVLGFSLSRLCFEGPEEELKRTENTQPAILTTSVALLRILENRGEAAGYVAGHSLGEYSALVAAGSLSFEDAVRLVRCRGRFMQEAVPAGQGAMAAILALTFEQVEAVCREAAQEEVVSVANINSPDQIVIAGHAGAVERSITLAKERGARRAVLLPVSAPFHCRLMESAEERLAELILELSISDARIPLVNNVEARMITRADEIKSGLIRQVSAPVRWSQSVETLARAGASTFVEVGPGKVLTGLIRRIVPPAKTINIGTKEEVAAHV